MHHRERSAMGKAIAELRADKRFIDACRVFNGLLPAHDHFHSVFATCPARDHFHSALSACTQDHHADSDAAARLAADAEAELAELKGPQATVAPSFEDADISVKIWSQRLDKLEASMAGPLEVVPEGGTDSMNELESVASAIMEFRQDLKRSCGYLNKDLKEDAQLQNLEERLDVLAGALFPAEHPSEIGAEDLRQWERRLAAQLETERQAIAGLSPSEAKEVARLVNEIADLKPTLAVQGLTEHEQEAGEQVLPRSTRLAELRQKERHDKKYNHQDKKHSKHSKHSQQLGAIHEDTHMVRDKLGDFKMQLHDEQGLSWKEIKKDEDVVELETRLANIEKMAGAAGA